MHQCDRENFLRNARWFVANGADGIYIPMDDTHPGKQVRERDGQAQALLVHDVAERICGRLRGICGEEYWGKSMEHTAYWTPILKVLPKQTMITWVGPAIWNQTLRACDMPAFDWPVLLWDNFFASDSPEPERAPIYPLSGREAFLLTKISGFILNPNIHYPWQYCALRTTFAFLENPCAYDASASFRQAVMELGDRSVSYTHLTLPTN